MNDARRKKRNRLDSLARYRLKTGDDSLSVFNEIRKRHSELMSFSQVSQYLFFELKSQLKIYASTNSSCDHTELKLHLESLEAEYELADEEKHRRIVEHAIDLYDNLVHDSEMTEYFHHWIRFWFRMDRIHSNNGTILGISGVCSLLGAFPQEAIKGPMRKKTMLDNTHPLRSFQNTSQVFEDIATKIETTAADEGIVEDDNNIPDLVNL
jgi:hypothetical protein